MKYTLIPSIIAHSQKELDSRMQKLSPLQPELIQLDIMDGQFVPQTSLEFDFKTPKDIKAEAHLMINEPTPWFVRNHAKISSVIIHYESKAHIHEFIKLAKKYKKKIGLAINPRTPIDDITQYLGHIDKVLIMTVNPGKYGSSFIPSMLNKINHLKETHPKLKIQVDGGIKPKTLFACAESGAHEFVVGSYLQKAKDVNSAWKELHAILKTS